jgi:hypothetical protein
VTPSSPLTSSVISPFSPSSSVAPVKRIVLPEPVGSAPMGMSSKASPRSVPPPCQLPDDVVAFGDQLGGGPEGEIGKASRNFVANRVPVTATAGACSEYLKRIIRSGVRIRSPADDVLCGARVNVLNYLGTDLVPAPSDDSEVATTVPREVEVWRQDDRPVGIAGGRGDAFHRRLSHLPASAGSSQVKSNVTEPSWKPTVRGLLSSSASVSRKRRCGTPSKERFRG